MFEKAKGINIRNNFIAQKYKIDLDIIDYFEDL